jgi:hypothetical protein
MKSIFFGFLALSIAIALSTSCDRVEIAYKDIPDLDSTFYPGLWADYLLDEWPEFEQNTNTQRNVLIEKYTGHKCVPCTYAATTVNNIHETNPNHIFYASIHAGPGGMTAFQEYNPSASSFYTNHTNPMALAYGVFFQNGYGFNGNPSIMVNKGLFGGAQGNMMIVNNENEINSRVNAILNDNALKYNIQAVFNYFPQTQGGYLHVEVEKLQNSNPDVDIVVYVIQDSLRDWQKRPSGFDDPDYLHKKKHLGNIDNLLWGQRLNFSAGNKVRKDYSFAKPVGIEPENIHFLIFVSDAETKEVYQVIKKKMVG